MNLEHFSIMGCGASNGGGGTQETKTLLMMGPANSGKTTVIKQIKLKYVPGGFTDQEKRELSDAVHQNCVTGIQYLLSQCALSISSASQEVQDAAKWVGKIPQEKCCNHEAGQCSLHDNALAAMKLLWDTPLIKNQSLANGPVENAARFLDDLDRLAGHTFVPTTEDMLCVRKRTEQADSFKFRMDKQQVSLWDIAGQKLERFKYNAGEENEISSLVFVASLPDFEGGLVLAEDAKTGRIKDCLNLFDLMCNRFFPDSPVILLLNKFDKFEEYAKAGRYAESPTFKDVPQGDRKNPKKLVEPIIKMFSSRAKNQVDTESFRHFTTTAIDPKNMEQIMECIYSIVTAGKVREFLGF